MCHCLRWTWACAGFSAGQSACRLCPPPGPLWPFVMVAVTQRLTSVKPQPLATVVAGRRGAHGGVALGNGSLEKHFLLSCGLCCRALEYKLGVSRGESDLSLLLTTQWLLTVTPPEHFLPVTLLTSCHQPHQGLSSQQFAPSRGEHCPSKCMSPKPVKVTLLGIWSLQMSLCQRP